MGMRGFDKKGTFKNGWGAPYALNRKKITAKNKLAELREAYEALAARQLFAYAV